MQISKTGIYNKKATGFTLLELLVVIFILSLITALVIPSFYGIGEGKLKSEAGKIASLLRYLNDTAISRKETFFLTLNLDTKIAKWETPEGKYSEKFESLLTISTTATKNISRGEITLFFNPLGLQESLIVTLKDKEQEMYVSFNPLSGRAKIISGSG
ncbi:MAG: prepilin-type N-terminal cleavage/methylation domain-containing protein [Nitrospirota bacterium]|nr:prepilin-type N-terminal cleavage/methylation domain-containing protein [Nitrospirota bacterium]MDH5768037.1 prepilin-type N-terminal cleavage/methylation domain-containing protein [Nitrospirota bacterium]